MKKHIELEVCTASQCSYIPFTPVPDGWAGMKVRIDLIQEQPDLITGSEEELNFYRSECALYREKAELIMAEVAKCDEENRAWIHKDLIADIIIGDAQT